MLGGAGWNPVVAGLSGQGRMLSTPAFNHRHRPACPEASQALIDAAQFRSAAYPSWQEVASLCRGSFTAYPRGHQQRAT